MSPKIHKYTAKPVFSDPNREIERGMKGFFNRLAGFRDTSEVAVHYKI
jgi:hypothetical protein